MANHAFRIFLLFTVLLNVASAITFMFLPDNLEYDTYGLKHWQEQDSDIVTNFNDAGNDPVRTNVLLSDEDEVSDKTWDIFNFGFVWKLLKFIWEFGSGMVTGMADLMNLMFQDALCSGTTPPCTKSTGLYGIMTGLSIFIYIMAAFQLWTGKDVTSQ